MTGDPNKGRRDGPSKDIAPDDRHSGEGVASVRSRLARTLADSARRSQDMQAEAMTARTPPEAPPEPDAKPLIP